MRTPQIIQADAFQAAQWISAKAHAAIASHGLFRLSLAGGTTPAAIYRELAKVSLPWDRVQLTFGDERGVPPEDPQSNYQMSKLSLLDHAPIPPGNVFRIRGEIDPEAAALEYEARLAAVAARFGEARYVHDLILLGMGADGHTASLFPGSPALDETVRNVVPAIGPNPPIQRVTMTFPLLNAARHVCFLVNDPGKKPVIREVHAGNQAYPAARIEPTNGEVSWILSGSME